jgi:hypothetical protein
MAFKNASENSNKYKNRKNKTKKGFLFPRNFGMTVLVLQLGAVKALKSRNTVIINY